MKNFLKKSIIPIIIVAVSAIMMLLYFTCFMPKVNSGDKAVTVKIVYLDNSFEYSAKTDKNTVLDLLIELDEVYDLGLVYEESEWGAFITSLKNVEQDTVNGYYYVYEIKGLDYAQGISIQTIKDGDVITFKYQKDTYDDNWNVIDSTLGGKGDADKHFTTKIIVIGVFSVLALLSVAYLVVSNIKKKDEN